MLKAVAIVRNVDHERRQRTAPEKTSPCGQITVTVSDICRTLLQRRSSQEQWKNLAMRTQQDLHGERWPGWRHTSCNERFSHVSVQSEQFYSSYIQVLCQLCHSIGPYSSVVERRSCKPEVRGSIPRVGTSMC